ncbi:coiled-coil domain-containing protein 38 [Engystomops pustulosus]|uniref:coiled-coil domain-containing protein 38 n=1 Tax=Engystomops pustulosus TaxID=76066 RepID=UPI003AFA7D28
MSKYPPQLPCLSAERKATLKKQNDPNSKPFVCMDKDLLTYGRREKEERAQNRILFRNLHICDKTTTASRAKALSFSLKDILEADAKPNEDVHSLCNMFDQQSTLSLLGYPVKRQSVKDYIAQTRKMSLAQLSIDTRQAAMREMKAILLKEKEKISDAEQKLEEEPKKYEELLRESERNVVEALKLADQQTKAKLEKVSEIRKVSAEILTLKSDIAKYEEILKEYKVYENFLRILSPPEWQDAQNQKRLIREAAKKKEQESRLTLPFLPETRRGEVKLMRSLSRAEAMREHGYLSRCRSSFTERRRSSTSSRSVSEASSDEQEKQTADSDSEEEPELYFTDPQELLQIFAELEEQNAILIKKAQELEETMQEIKARENITQERMNQKIKTLNEHKKMYLETLAKEQEQIAELELKAKMFHFGNVKTEDQDRILSALKNKITEVYTCCIGEVQAAINAVQMLSSIENRLGELQDMLESLPQDAVSAVQKVKQRERRMRMRQEKLKDALEKQEERMIRALERASAPPRKAVGRKLMKRSEPPPQSKRQNQIVVQELAARKQEEYNYFFT